jgi:hypothetical protein
MVKVELAGKDLELVTRAVSNYLVDVSTLLGDNHSKVIEIEKVLSILESGN